jgi:hypothetical protein
MLLLVSLLLLASPPPVTPHLTWSGLKTTYSDPTEIEVCLSSDVAIPEDRELTAPILERYHGESGKWEPGVSIFDPCTDAPVTLEAGQLECVGADLSPFVPSVVCPKYDPDPDQPSSGPSWRESHECRLRSLRSPKGFKTGSVVRATGGKYRFVVLFPPVPWQQVSNAGDLVRLASPEFAITPSEASE